MNFLAFQLASKHGLRVDGPIRVIPDWRGVVESDQLTTFRSSIRIQAFNDIGRLSAKDVLGIYVHGLPGA